MAHFAELDANDVVLRVIVVNNNVLMNPKTGQEEEDRGIEFCRSLFGQGTRWVQTSYNGSRRKRYAGIGYTYERANDRFISPPPFQSWKLNPGTGDWEPPTPMPQNGKRYWWDEPTQSWAEIAPPG